ncbi:hypothetical protein C8T65DRAFT_642811 [Cerioporus squamosus]|nr:hypothetical protein C8T65DRAFT_642811 [Cerioporus squamosus]
MVLRRWPTRLPRPSEVNESSWSEVAGRATYVLTPSRWRLQCRGRTWVSLHIQ